MGGIISNKRRQTAKSIVYQEDQLKKVDIRMVKKELRQKYRNQREAMNPIIKLRFDADIISRLLNFSIYMEAKTVFCFVSTDLEVNTIPILEDAWKKGKSVAVPKCLDKDGNMEFYLIKSMDDLRPSMFDLLEPDPAHALVCCDYENSICILPGFGFDRFGYRIGFGKGYYDRFLQRFTGTKVGICYNNCIGSEFPHGRYDAAADYIVTQKYIMTVAKPVRVEEEG